MSPVVPHGVHALPLESPNVGQFLALGQIFQGLCPQLELDRPGGLAAQAFAMFQRIVHIGHQVDIPQRLQLDVIHRLLLDLLDLAAGASAGEYQRHWQPP